MRKQIEERMKEVINKNGTNKGSFRIYVNKSNLDWYLYTNSVVWVDVKFEEGRLDYDTIAEQTCIGCEGHKIWGGYYFIDSIAL